MWRRIQGDISVVFSMLDFVSLEIIELFPSTTTIIHNYTTRQQVIVRIGHVNGTQVCMYVYVHISLQALTVIRQDISNKFQHPICSNKRKSEYTGGILTSTSMPSQFWQENRPDYVNIQLYLSQTDGIQVCGWILL